MFQTRTPPSSSSPPTLPTAATTRATSGRLHLGGRSTRLSLVRHPPAQRPPRSRRGHRCPVEPGLGAGVAFAAVWMVSAATFAAVAYAVELRGATVSDPDFVKVLPQLAWMVRLLGEGFAV